MIYGHASHVGNVTRAVLTNFFPSAPGSSLRNLVITGSVTFEEMFEIIILHMTVLHQR